MLIVGERVSVAANDKQELVPTVATIRPVVVEEIKAVWVDRGFYREAAVQAVERKPDGTPRGVTVYAAGEKPSHHKTVANWLPQAEPAAPGPEATAQEGQGASIENRSGPGPLQDAPADGGAGV